MGTKFGNLGIWGFCGLNIISTHSFRMEWQITKHDSSIVKNVPFTNLFLLIRLNKTVLFCSKNLIAIYQLRKYRNNKD